MSETQDRYDARGVSSSKNEVHDAIASLNKGIYPTAFCKILPDLLGGDKEFCNIMHADGAGTKSSLAYAYWKKTGDMSVWRGIAQDAFVMNLDDLLCAGVTDQPILYTSTIGRNKRLIPGDVIKEIIIANEELVQKMNDFGMNITLAGGETADLGDLVRTIIVDGTMTTRIKRKDVLVPNIKPGSVVIGLSSSGQASYEDSYNSGMGSNGLTSARHDIFNKSVGLEYPDTFDLNAEHPELMYCGKHDLQDLIHLDGHDYEAGKMILSPTRTYAPVVLELMRVMLPDDIQAIIHCSGGGQTKVSRFLPEGVMVVKNNLFKNDLFKLIQAETGTPWNQMYTAFNMGHRMEIYCKDKVAASKIAGIVDKFKIDTMLIGECFERENDNPAIRIIRQGVNYDY